VLGEVDHPEGLNINLDRVSHMVNEMWMDGPNGSGHVSDFEIITVDIVAQPSAPGAYPEPIYEHLMNTKGGLKAFNSARDTKAQKYLKEQLINIIGKLQSK
jgi:hypothetical protein